MLALTKPPTTTSAACVEHLAPAPRVSSTRQQAAGSRQPRNPDTLAPAAPPSPATSAANSPRTVTYRQAPHRGREGVGDQHAKRARQLRHAGHQALPRRHVRRTPRLARSSSTQLTCGPTSNATARAGGARCPRRNPAATAAPTHPCQRCVCHSAQHARATRIRTSVVQQPRPRPHNSRPRHHVQSVLLPR